MNEKKFKELFDECQAFCLHRLNRLTRSKTDAEDVFMEAISRFWVDLQAGKVKHQKNIRGFLYIVAKRLWIDKTRKVQFQRTHLIGEANIELTVKIQANQYYTDTYDTLIQQETRTAKKQKMAEEKALLDRALAKLGKRCQNILVKSIVYKIPLKQIAQELGFSNANTVKVAKSRCKKQLIHAYQTLQTNTK